MHFEVPISAVYRSQAPLKTKVATRYTPESASGLQDT